MTTLVCGEALFDVFPGEETDTGVILDARLGGAALNVASGLARLGSPVALLAGVTCGGLGERIVRFMEAEGIETRALKRTDAPVTLVMVTRASDGSARYRFYGEGAADRTIGPDDLPDLAPVRHLVFGSLSMLTMPTGEALHVLARRASTRSPKPLVVLDPNVRLPANADATLWRDRVALFAREADLIKVSAEDLAALYGAAADQAVARWLAGPPRAVVVTHGADGLAWHDGGAPIHEPAVPVDVVDTVGAGDSVCAALIAGLVELGADHPDGLARLTVRDRRRLLRFAAGAAAVTCGRRGAALPRRDECPHL